MTEAEEKIMNVLGAIICWATLFLLIATRMIDIENAVNGADAMDIIVAVLVGISTATWITWRLSKTGGNKK